MNKSIRFNGSLYDELQEVQQYYKTEYGLDVSMNWLCNHLIQQGLKSAVLLQNVYSG